MCWTLIPVRSIDRGRPSCRSELVTRRGVRVGKTVTDSRVMGCVCLLACMYLARVHVCVSPITYRYSCTRIASNVRVLSTNKYGVMDCCENELLFILVATCYILLTD